MSFFIRNQHDNKGFTRKVNGLKHKDSKNQGSKGKKRSFKKHANDNESIGSTDEEIAEEEERNLDSSSEDEDEETAQEKRLRLAKKYLEEIEEEERDRADFEEGAITKRLKQDYLEEKGRLRKIIADTYVGHDTPFILRCKDHKNSITCICLSSNGQFLYSGSKDGSLVKWSLHDRQKLKSLKGKSKSTAGMSSIRCMAVSTDNKFLVVGADDSKNIKVFSALDLSHIKDLQGHRDIVSGLVFRMHTHTLYSASLDRCVKIWNLDEMAYVDTLFGHQSGITSIDSLSRERAITSGGFDGTVRIWKIVEESQLIFNAHGGSIDAVKLINEENFLSCGDDGQLCVWGCLKKKPLCSVSEAHGRDEINSLPHWISSIATFLNTDLVASGSKNGVIKLWKCGESFRSLHPLFDISINGFINSLIFTSDGKYLVAAIGQEHKLGRWWRIPEAKNSIAIIPLVTNNRDFQIK
ncbi:PREDICTED: U3 small nucleolar RNA-interacting protein 2 [Ceratosolen solmsi marchali]|uniref:U3 small nucleolar RNA-interacting protein 2 n=1 Tax=Ceratosolen solmsi marchali TaxID=326594 RepID=A0AAJ6YHN9_9HYME|nr:PREDICTED: U3 small nucleolar RNA-interacting protein 2 [Ceratosolen solmsi marchali]